jgi:hypothetical protein
MSTVSIELGAHQTYILSPALENDQVTITGPANARVINDGTYQMQGGDSLRIIGPRLEGRGTITAQNELTPGVGYSFPQLELGAVSRGETVSFIHANSATLQLDTPRQFLGTLHGENQYTDPIGGTGQSSPDATHTVEVSNALIVMPGLTLDHATLRDHVLSIFGSQDQLEARLRMPGVDVVALDSNGLYGTSTLPAGVSITPSDFADENALIQHN